MKIEFKKQYTEKEFLSIFSSCVLCGSKCKFSKWPGIQETGELPFQILYCHNCKFRAEFTEYLNQIFAGWILKEWNIVINNKGVAISKTMIPTASSYKIITRETNVDIVEIAKIAEKYKVLA